MSERQHCQVLVSRTHAGGTVAPPGVDISPRRHHEEQQRQSVYRRTSRQYAEGGSIAMLVCLFIELISTSRPCVLQNFTS